MEDFFAFETEDSEEDLFLLPHSSSQATSDPSAASMSDRKSEPSRDLGALAIMQNLVLNVLLIFVTIYIIWQAFRDGTVLFSWHPTLMSIGFTLLMSQAILSLSDTNYLNRKSAFNDRITVHWLLQMSTIVCITLAFLAILINKNRFEKPHFETVHSKLGISTFILTLVAALGGVWTKFSFSLRNYLKPVYAKLGHTLFGIGIYVLAMITICFGIYSNWFIGRSESYTRAIILIIITYTTICVVFRPLVVAFDRIKKLNSK